MLCDVCFFPRLKDFILNQDWNDPKSQLQQCCLTLRKMGAGEPDIPFYKVIESLGPSNTRKYVVAVYFRGERLATGTGHSIQQAEMSAANNALKIRSELFPILQHQRRFLDWQSERRSRPQQYRLSPSPAKVARGENRTGRSRKPAAASSSSASGAHRPTKNNNKNLRSSSSSLSVSLGRPRPRQSDSRDRMSLTSREGSWSRDYSSDGRASSMSRSDRGRRSDSRSSFSRRSSPFSPPFAGSRPRVRGRSGAGPGSSSSAAPSLSQSPRVGGSADSLSGSPPENWNM